MTEETPVLYPDPVSVVLNTEEGYRLNKLTGDSIKTLLNSVGDTVKTGIPVLFKGIMVDPKEVSPPKIIKAGSPLKLTIAGNVLPGPDQLEIIPVDTNQLKKIKLGEGDQSFVLRNAAGIVPTGVAIPVTGKKMPFREPSSVKALPLRFKDAATANVQYLDVDQGLSGSYVYTLLEDKRGNLWFGLDGTGVSRYDGVSFTNYTTKEGLSDNYIFSMLEDSKGNIWLGTNKGLTSFDGKNFIQFTEQEGFPSKRVLSILEDKKGNLWFAPEGSGVIKYDGKNFTHYTTREGLPSDSVITCMEDRSGNLWLGTYHGAARFDGNTFTWYTQKDGLKSGGVSCLLEDKAGNIWLSCRYAGITKYDGKSFTNYSEKEGVSNNAVWSFLEDINGNIWIGTSFGGINKFDGKSFTRYNLAEGLSNNKVRKIIKDSNGNIWFGTDGGGVNKLNDGDFGYLPPNEVLTNNRPRPIIKDKKGNMWFGTEGGGIGKYNPGVFSGTAAILTYYKDKAVFNIPGQRSLLVDKNDNVWAGTGDIGVIRFDGNFFTNYSIKEGLPGHTVFSILEDKKGDIWFGTKDKCGLAKYNGRQFTQFTQKEGLPGAAVFSLLEDKNGNLWIGTDGGGLSKYDGTNLVTYSEKEGLFSSSITSIISDMKGNLWLGTIGAGVCRFDGKQFTYYTEREGLSNNNVWSLIEDSLGHIWAGTDKGLNRLVPQAMNQKDTTWKYVIYKYGLQDGLKAMDFSLHGACIDNNNNIWWGTGKNIVIKNLRQSFNTGIARSLTLTAVEINDRFYDYRNLPDSVATKIKFSNVAAFKSYPTGLKLSHDQNHLRFNFSAIDWAAPDKIKYSFRLIGLDNKWSNPSEETKVDYRDLSYGNYEFQVKASGQSQVWTETFVYNFTIHPAWWQTWWFKALIILASLSVAFFAARFIYFYQLRRQTVVMEKKLAVQYERQRISAEMHDDIGAGLSGIRLLTEMTKNKVKDEQTAEEVEKIYQSVGDISSKMKEVIWSLNTENDKLVNLISYIQKQVRLWLEHYPCRLTVEMPDAIPDVQVNGEDRRNIFLIVKEAIHNVIKHSGADKVNLTMACNNGQFVITVSDNGKGLADEKNNDSGNGMKNMQQRIEKLSGKFFIKNQEGLTLTFEIPIQPAT